VIYKIINLNQKQQWAQNTALRNTTSDIMSTGIATFKKKL